MSWATLACEGRFESFATLVPIPRDLGLAAPPHLSNATDSVHYRVVAERRFSRTFEGKGTIEFACRVPFGTRTRFRVTLVGERDALVDVVHAALSPGGEWISHSVELPASPAAVTLRFERHSGTRSGRLLARLGLARESLGAAFSEPFLLPPIVGRSSDPLPNRAVVGARHARQSGVVALGLICSEKLGDVRDFRTPVEYDELRLVNPRDERELREFLELPIRKYGDRGPWGLDLIVDRGCAGLDVSAEEAMETVRRLLRELLRAKGLLAQTELS